VIWQCAWGSLVYAVWRAGAASQQAEQPSARGIERFDTGRSWSAACRVANRGPRRYLEVVP
jgi:hypothetical protein